jgi:hypothetical protein
MVAEFADLMRRPGTNRAREAVSMIADFLGIRMGGNWELYGQQNSPGQANGGVRNMMRLYP